MTDPTLHLSALLDERNEQIELLQEKLRDAEDRLKSDLYWTLHRDMADEDFSYPDLPVPRLQMTWKESYIEIRGERRFHSWYAEYGLVYRFVRGNVILIPIGGTRITGQRGNGPKRDDGSIRTPFRDGAHILSDANHLNLPAYVCWAGEVHDLADDVKEFARREDQRSR